MRGLKADAQAMITADADVNDEKRRRVRRKEQKKTALIYATRRELPGLYKASTKKNCFNGQRPASAMCVTRGP